VTGVVSGVGGTTILVANAYATMSAVSHAVGAMGVGSSGNAVAVADVGANAEVSMGAAMIGTGTATTAGATSASATTAEGDVDGGDADAEGGGDDNGGAGGDGPSCHSGLILRFHGPRAKLYTEASSPPHI
jgi:hypothetical protein